MIDWKDRENSYIARYVWPILKVKHHERGKCYLMEKKKILYYCNRIIIQELISKT